jgi:ribonuclease-3
MTPDRAVELARLEGALGHKFALREYLHAALVHRSYCAENPDAQPNERLEFLGDAVLGLSVTDHIFDAYPELPEGELAKLRASVVNAQALAALADELDLGSALLLGKGEDASGGRAKPSILADTMEAVIAAVYLDGGWEAADALVLRLLGAQIREGSTGPGGGDYKTRLQELAARHFDQLPRYHLRSDGPDHSKRFYATVMLRGQSYGDGEGRSKKQAEQEAARVAWERLQAEETESSGDAPALASSAAREGNDA